MNFAVVKHNIPGKRFGFTYTVFQDDVRIVAQVPYLKARSALHQAGVSGGTWLDRLDSVPTGQVINFVV